MIHILDYIIVIGFTIVGNRYFNDQINFNLMFLLFSLIYLMI